jgi:prevent-host-death family protein
MEAGVPAPDSFEPRPTSVGIRELRHDARRWVERARAGERIVITDRGVPVADLVSHVPKRSFLQELYDTGQIIRARGPVRPAWHPDDPITTTLSDILRDMRDEDDR